MAKAKAEKLVTRVIVGPKGIWVKGELKGIGETVKLTARTAKAFSRYLEAPGVAKAKAAVKEAEEADVEDENEAPAEDEGGDSGDGT